MENLINTNRELEYVLNQITFKNTVLDFKWKFEYRPFIASDPDGTPRERGWLVRVSFERPDTITGKIGRGHGRDEVIWEGTSESGVVKTCWLLVELMVRHELMEGFRWDDARIFNPHNTVKALASLQKQHNKENGL
jgi:hypothetical protein